MFSTPGSKTSKLDVGATEDAPYFQRRLATQGRRGNSYADTMAKRNTSEVN